MSAIAPDRTQRIAVENVVATFRSRLDGGDDRLETSGHLAVTRRPGEETVLAGPLLYTLGAAADALDLSRGELRLALDEGIPLDELATSRGTSADRLIAAMVDDARTRLDTYVVAGVLSPDQRDRLLADLDDRIVELVAGGAPPGR